MDAFERWVRAGAEFGGRTVDDVDLAVARAVDDAYGPKMRELTALDLAHVLPEPEMDPGTAPRS